LVAARFCKTRFAPLSLVSGEHCLVWTVSSNGQIWRQHINVLCMS